MIIFVINQKVNHCCEIMKDMKNRQTVLEIETLPIKSEK